MVNNNKKVFTVGIIPLFRHQNNYYCANSTDQRWIQNLVNHIRRSAIVVNYLRKMLYLRCLTGF